MQKIMNEDVTEKAKSGSNKRVSSQTDIRNEPENEKNQVYFVRSAQDTVQKTKGREYRLICSDSKDADASSEHIHKLNLINKEYHDYQKVNHQKQINSKTPTNGIFSAFPSMDQQTSSGLLNPSNMHKSGRHSVQDSTVSDQNMTATFLASGLKSQLEVITNEKINYKNKNKGSFEIHSK